MICEDSGGGRLRGACTSSATHHVTVDGRVVVTLCARHARAIVKWRNHTCRWPGARARMEKIK